MLFTFLSVIHQPFASALAIRFYRMLRATTTTHLGQAKPKSKPAASPVPPIGARSARSDVTSTVFRNYKTLLRVTAGKKVSENECA